MRTCADCGAPVLAAWEYCKRCGAELQSAPTGGDEPRWVHALSTPRFGFRGSPGERVAQLRDRLRVPVPAAMPRLALPRLALVLPVLVALLVGLGAGSLLAADSGGEARVALADARAGAEEARAEVAQLHADLAAAEEERDEIAAELKATREELETLEQRLAGGEEEVGALEEELEALRERLEEGEETLEQRERELAERHAAVAALVECLSGTEVALAFARDGRSDSAVDRALEAVEETCQQARAVR